MEPLVDADDDISIQGSLDSDSYLDVDSDYDIDFGDYPDSSDDNLDV